MRSAYSTLAAASLLAGGAVFYVHARQRSERERMHRGVLRDIAREQAEKSPTRASTQEVQILSVDLPRTAVDATIGGAGDGGSASKPAVETSASPCEAGICDLAQARFRDPVTGAVYAPLPR